MSSWNGNGQTRSGLPPFASADNEQLLRDIHEMAANASMMSRQWLQSLFDDRRDLASECGWPPDGGGSTGIGNAVPIELYRALYDREPVATKVCEVLPRESWQASPLVYEDEDTRKVTAFEEAWDSLGRTLSQNNGQQSWYQDETGSPVFEYLERADIRSGIGSFGIILLGIDDGLPLQEPVRGMLMPPAQAILQGAGQSDKHRSQGAPDEGGFQPQMADATIQAGSRYVPLSQRQAGGPLGNRLNTWTTMADGLPMPWEIENLKNQKPRNIWLGGWQGKGKDAKPVLHEIAPLPLTPLEQRIVANWERQRTIAVNAFKQVSEMKGPQTASGPLGKTQDGSMSPYDKDGNPVGPQQSFEDAQMRELGWGTMSSYAMPIGSSLAGTDQQYFGVQLGPPEMLNPAAGGPGGRAIGTGSAPSQRKLLFMRVFDESLVQVVRYEWNVRNPRFGLPVMYRVTLNDPREMHSGVGLPLATVFVHWTRVVHLADNRGNSEIFGVPRQRPVLNALLDTRKISGASAEGYYKTCFTGLAFSTHPQLGGDVQVDRDSLDDQYEQYINSLQRAFYLSGMDVKTIAPSIVDPTPHLDVQIKRICIYLNIPQRIFIGSERGELASSQDDSKWNDVLRHRQNGYLTPRVIVPFVDRLIMLGILPKPTGYSVEWPDIDSQTDLQKAQVAGAKMAALSAYVQGGVQAILQPHDMYTRVMGMDEEEADEVLEAVVGEGKAGEEEMPGQVAPHEDSSQPGATDEDNSDTSIPPELHDLLGNPDVPSDQELQAAQGVDQFGNPLQQGQGYGSQEQAGVGGGGSPGDRGPDQGAEGQGGGPGANPGGNGPSQGGPNPQAAGEQGVADEDEGEHIVARKTKPDVNPPPPAPPAPPPGKGGPPGAGGGGGQPPGAGQGGPPGQLPPDKQQMKIAATAKAQQAAKGKKPNPFARNVRTENVAGIGSASDSSLDLAWFRENPLANLDFVINEFHASGVLNASFFAECVRVPKGEPNAGSCEGQTGKVVDCGNDLYLAAKMLAKGARVTLDQKDQVSTLISKMQSMIDEAVAKGKDAPKFDLCKVSVEGSNLFCQENIGVPRVQMPQMRGSPVEGSEADKLKRNKVGKVDVGEMFVQHLKDSGIEVEEVNVRASHLRASQNEIDGARIADLVTTRSADELRKRPIFVTRDNYVVDGHHHWAALIGKGGGKDFKLPVYRIDCDIGTALHMANAYAKQVGIKPKSVPGATSNRRGSEASPASRRRMPGLLAWWLVENGLTDNFEGQERDERGRFGEGTSSSQEKAAGVARRVFSALGSGIRKVGKLIDSELNGGVSTIVEGMKTRSPKMIAQGIALAVTASYNEVHEEVFENAMAAHSFGGAHAVGVLGAKAIAKAHEGLVKAVGAAFKRVGLTRNELMATLNADKDTFTSDQLHGDHYIFDGEDNAVDAVILDHATKQTMIAVKALHDQLGLDAPLPKPEDVRERLWVRLHGSAKDEPTTENAKDRFGHGSEKHLSLREKMAKEAADAEEEHLAAWGKPDFEEKLKKTMELEKALEAYDEEVAKANKEAEDKEQRRTENFDESKVKRDKGKFSSTGGAGAATPPAPKVHDHAAASHGAHDPLEHLGHQAHTAHEAHEVAEAGAGLVGGHAAEHGAAEAGGEHGHGPLEAGAIVARNLYGPALRMATHLMQHVPGMKTVGKAIAALHDGATKLSQKATQGMIDRYGKATAGAILGAGNLTHGAVLGAAGVVGPGAKALPGLKFVGSIPLLAVAEVAKQLGIVGQGSKLEAGLAKVGSWVHAFKSAVGAGASKLGQAGHKAAFLAGRGVGKLIGNEESGWWLEFEDGSLLACNAAGVPFGKQQQGGQDDGQERGGDGQRTDPQDLGRQNQQDGRGAAGTPPQAGPGGQVQGDQPVEAGGAAGAQPGDGSGQDVQGSDLQGQVTLTPEEMEAAAHAFMDEIGQGFGKLLEQHRDDLMAAQPDEDKSEGPDDQGDDDEQEAEDADQGMGDDGADAGGDGDGQPQGGGPAAGGGSAAGIGSTAVGTGTTGASSDQDSVSQESQQAQQTAIGQPPPTAKPAKPLGMPPSRPMPTGNARRLYDEFRKMLEDL